MQAPHLVFTGPEFEGKPERLSPDMELEEALIVFYASPHATKVRSIARTS